MFSASDWDDAKHELEVRKPDIMFLDSIVKQRSTIALVDELDESINTKIVLILNGKEQIPKDTVLIVHTIKKPFNSAEVLAAVKIVTDGPSAPKKEAEKKTRWFKFLMRSKDGDGMVEKMVSDNPVRLGNSYIVYEDEPDRIYEIANSFNRTERDEADKGDLLVISCSAKKLIESKIQVKSAKYILLSRNTREEYLNIASLGTLMHRILHHIETECTPVIIIDDLTQIIRKNGLNSVLTMIYQLYASFDRPAVIAVSVMESLLTEKDKGLLTRYMEVYRTYEEESKGE